MDQEAHVLQPLVDRQVPRLLGHPGAVRVCGHAGEMDAPRAVLDPEQHVQRPQPDCLDREEVAGDDPMRLRAQELRPRRAACAAAPGPAHAARRSVLIVVAPTRIPSLRNSPWIRTQPQRGFSRANRSTSSRSSGSSGGRPAGRRRYVHFRRTNSRCQRKSVCGDTTNTDHRSRGSSRSPPRARPDHAAAAPAASPSAAAHSSW